MSDQNYYSDFRVRALSAQIEPIVTDEDGEDHELPTKFKVCPTCEGRGTHVNPSIDCDGLTADDFDSDPDFRSHYLGGVYDVQCYGCKGLRVVEMVDEERCPPELLELYRKEQADEASYQRECEMERRMGA